MANLKPTIFFLTSRFPYPLEKGDKLRAFHQIKCLSEKYNIILCSLTLTNVKDEWKNELNKYCSEIHVIKLNRFSVYIGTAKMFFKQQPFQIGYFFQKKIKSKIHKIINENNVNYIYCQLVRCAEYVKDIHTIPKVLDFMDALSIGMYRRAEITSGLKKIIYKIEADRLKTYENKIFDYFDSHTIISEQDRKFISHPLNKSIIVVENGIDEYFFNFDSSCIKKEYDIVFVGNLSYPPNVESCLFIANRIIPYFEAKGEPITVLLSGANPSQAVLKLNENKNITVGGWVDDIRESYCQGKVFVAPLFIGTGLQNKLLEAMALNIPCVTTTLANKALGAIDGENILIANDSKEFYEKITRLIGDNNAKNKLVKNAKEFVMTNYSWENSVNKIPFGFKSELMEK
jgi:sugar transferase (PEP-CTERM/EpsH1 system associated)